jgi:hypothetical protein
MSDTEPSGLNLDVVTDPGSGEQYVGATSLDGFLDALAKRAEVLDPVERAVVLKIRGLLANALDGPGDRPNSLEWS